MPDSSTSWSRRARLVAAFGGLAALLASCGARIPEMTAGEIAFTEKASVNSLLARVTNRQGSTDPYARGVAGGTWTSDIVEDPKSFNPLNAKDGETEAVIRNLGDDLLDYDLYTKKWKANAASYTVKTMPDGTMQVIFTLRDDLYWTTLAEPGKRVKVTSDDVVFWFNDIEGDPYLRQSGYAGQFIPMPDGGTKRIVARKLDDRTFVLIYPRAVAEPELSSNMDFGPRYIFEPLKERGGDKALLNLWSIDTDPKTIPSMGPYYIQSYTPAVGVTLVRNPSYWRKDDFGQPIPYIQQAEIKIVTSTETAKLKFLSGDLDSYGPRPEDLDEMVNRTPKDYTVYYAGPALGADFISWNQNPKVLAPKYVKWFSNVDFRRAMACLLNRDRIVNEVFRGLAEPDLDLFSKANPFYDPSIQEGYTYDPSRAKALLAGIGIKPDATGRMVDADGDPVAYDLMVTVSDNRLVDMANIFADELKRIGITLTVRPLDFNKIVESLVQGYDWQAVMISIGAAFFPVEGQNVWLSGGDLHLWYPLESKPATDWEAEIDDLYWKGYTERDPAAAAATWSQFQRIILSEVPILYLVYPDNFVAVRDKWANVRVDNFSSPDLNYVSLRP